MGGGGDGTLEGHTSGAAKAMGWRPAIEAAKEWGGDRQSRRALKSHIALQTSPHNTMQTPPTQRCPHSSQTRTGLCRRHTQNAHAWRPFAPGSTRR